MRKMIPFIVATAAWGLLYGLVVHPELPRLTTALYAALRAF